MRIPQAITDLINLEIPKYHRIWKPFMEKYHCQKIAEVGVFTGENFALMIEHNPKLAVAVDIWKNDGIIAHNDLNYSQKTLNKMHKDFIQKISNKPFVLTYREYSHKAAKHLPNNYFDLVYIDADHTFTGCFTDLKSWYPKVKKGGFLLGDDFSNKLRRSGVKVEVAKAVTKFAEANQLNFYRLPRYGWAIIK